MIQELKLKHSESGKKIYKDVKSYYTASSIHRTPSRYTPLKHFSYQSLPHIPISGNEGRMILYSEVFIDFFYELLAVESTHLDIPLKDLLCIIEIGIPVYDYQKKADISLAIGDKYEEISKSLSALKFYKAAYQAYKLSNDTAGKSIALNRLGIAYHNRGYFIKALKMHKNHKKICNEDFIPYYNLGIVHRAIKKFVSSSRCLLNALNIAQDKNQREEICIANAQLGLTYKAMNELELADRRLCDALKVAKEIRASEIAVELKIALAYLAFHRGNIKESEKYFISSMKSVIGEKSEICRINVGILRGEEELTNKFSYYK